MTPISDHPLPDSDRSEHAPLLSGLAAAAIALLLLALCFGWDYLPGTLRFDGQGFPHGTGTKKYFYNTGPLKLEERYRAGFLYEGTWYRPDGSIVATAAADRKNGGPWYYLREDGTIRERVENRYDPKTNSCLAHGTATFYNPDGTVERQVEYRDGSPVDPKP